MTGGDIKSPGAAPADDSSQEILISSEPSLDVLLKLDLRSALKEAFSNLSGGRAVQPPQTLTLFPGGRGDNITYLGVIESLDVFGAKLSPYMPDLKQSVTAWTLLMSMKTGGPLLLTSSMGLTRERTAATTALAVEYLARSDSSRLAIIGTGDQALAHLRHAAPLRPWKEVRVFSPRLSEKPEKLAPFEEFLKGKEIGISAAKSASECADGADAILLCTSAGSPVIDLKDVSPGTLVTSISTNVPKAHEIAPEALPLMDVYCDYMASTLSVAGEMILAAASGIWNKDKILSDLPALCSGLFKPKPGDRPIFFRSVGLGIEDVAAAHALYQFAGAIRPKA